MKPSHTSTPALPKADPYRPHLGQKEDSPADLVLNSFNNFIEVQDAWVFTPLLRNTQFLSANPNIFSATPSAHDVFLPIFILGSVVSVIQTIASYFGVGRAKNLAEIAKGFDLDEDQSTPAGIKILAEAYILDPDNNYQRTYAVLISDPNLKRPIVAKRSANEDLVADERELYLSNLEKAWESAKNSKQPISKSPQKPWWKKRMAEFQFSLNFFMKMAMWYWMLWIIASGFFVMSGAVLLPFASPLIAFVLPVVLTLVEYGIRAVLAYRNRNNAADPQLNNLVETLLKIKLVESGVFEKVGPLTKEKLFKWAGKSQNPEIKAILDSSAWEEKIPALKSKARIFSKAVLSFTSFFTLAAFLAWPLTDFLALHGITAGALLAAGSLASSLSIIIVPMAISLAIGVLFAAVTFHEESKKEKLLADKFDHTNIAQQKRELNDLVQEVRLRRLYLKFKGVDNLLSPVSVENPHFFERFSLDKESKISKLWNRLKAFFAPVNSLVKGLGTGTLVARLFIAIVASLAQIGLLASFGYLSVAVIVPIVLVAVALGGISIYSYYQQRQLQKAEQSLNQISAELAVYQRENHWLKEQELRIPARNPAPRVVAREASIAGLVRGSTVTRGDAETARLVDDESELNEESDGEGGSPHPHKD